MSEPGPAPDSDPDLASPDPTHDRDGDMGVSSERVGPTGPGQTARTGERDVTTGAGPGGVPAVGPEDEPDPEEVAPPEQSAGGREENPAGLHPKAGYPSADPRSADEPYQP
ncbi:hypothetical protein [Nocardioides ochotonae]|uniref:hypothetical protein n=1 Tax=Nocardioides ochotonae TaxID=2685869 RepID=UPI001408B113|nr:hypothetical protein [Nocardioides ochotonae]